MIYELYDWDTANLISAYDSEAEALAGVARYVTAHGRGAVETWTLLRSTPDGTHKENVAAGDVLAGLALHLRTGAA